MIFFVLWSSTNYRRDPALRYRSADDPYETKVWLWEHLACRQMYSSKNKNFLPLSTVHHLIISFPSLHVFMEESYPSSIPIFLTSSQVLYHRLLWILCFPAAVPWMHIRPGDAPSRAPSPTPLARRKVKTGKTPRISCARLQSEKQPGLPQPSGAAWCPDCSNSCCCVIISGRMCLPRVTLLIPAAENREQQGNRRGGKTSGL